MKVQLYGGPDAGRTLEVDPFHPPLVIRTPVIPKLIAVYGGDEPRADDFVFRVNEYRRVEGRFGAIAYRYEATR